MTAENIVNNHQNSSKPVNDLPQKPDAGSRIGAGGEEGQKESLPHAAE